MPSLDSRSTRHGSRRSCARSLGDHEASLLDYRLPTALDTPEVSALLVESNDPEGPYGAKEAGEGPLRPAIPAIANAIHDAVGVRIDRLPFSPERVLSTLAATARR